MSAETHIAVFRRIVDALRHAVALCAARGAFGPPEQTLAPAIHRRLTSLATRFCTLAARHAAGTLAPPRKRVPKPRPEREYPKPVLPRRRGFLADAGHEIRGHAAQLAHFLLQPETAALIAADPRFGRTLRPLCHLLRLDPPPFLRLPPKPRKPRKPRPPRRRAGRRRAGPATKPSPLWLTLPCPESARTRFMPTPRRSRAPPA